MGYDHDDSFTFDSEPNGIPFGSKSKGKLSPRSYPIQFERKWKYSFLSAWYSLVSMNSSQAREFSFVTCLDFISEKMLPFRIILCAFISWPK